MLPALKNWETHDFAVKMLDWSAARGSKLAYRCRRCGRTFCHFSGAVGNMWAIDGEGHTLEGAISNRWLSEECPRLFNTKDDEDRKQLYKPDAA